MARGYDANLLQHIGIGIGVAELPSSASNKALPTRLPFWWKNGRRVGQTRRIIAPAPAPDLCIMKYYSWLASLAGNLFRRVPQKSAYEKLLL